MTSITPVTHLARRSHAGTCERVRIATIPLAATLAVVWAVSLSRSLFDPIGFDHALYQYITERVMVGERMYVDVWDQNAPGIIGIHWLSTHLVGRSPMALRIFDAGWQAMTLIALVALGARDNRRWQVGWLATTLYALAYYGIGYVNTAQREGFAVLPLLLAAHAVVSTRRQARGDRTFAARHFFAGVMGFVVFALKPPLGLCFGALWLLTLADARRPRGRGHSTYTGIIASSAGFILSAAAAAMLLVRLGWWDGFWPVLTRQDVPGYIRGLRLARELTPYVLAGLPVIAVAAWLVRASGNGRGSTPASRQLRQWARMLVAGLVVFGMFLTVQRWQAWQQTFVRLAGLLLPALGAMLLCTWRERSPIWRMSALLAVAAFAALVWQGWFFLYHFPPLLAFAAYLAAHELVDRFRHFSAHSLATRVWAMACLAGTTHLAVSTWGWTMTFYTRSPYALYALSDVTLEEHYTRVTRHKTRFPTYETTARVAERVRALTAESDPIACLIDEPRIYYLSQRPSVHPLLRTQNCYRHKFPGLLRAIRDKSPKVVLARIPRDLPDTGDRSTIQSAVFDDLESYFGPPAQVIRESYRVTEIINNDVCILQPA